MTMIQSLKYFTNYAKSFASTRATPDVVLEFPVPDAHFRVFARILFLGMTRGGGGQP